MVKIRNTRECENSMEARSSPGCAASFAAAPGFVGIARVHMINAMSVSSSVFTTKLSHAGWLGETSGRLLLFLNCRWLELGRWLLGGDRG